MSAPSHLNPDATVFIPSHPRASSAFVDPTTTTVLLAYFSSLCAPRPNVQPSAHSTSTSAKTHCRSNQPYHSNFPYQSNHHAARSAMAEFTSYYGDDPSNVAAWQALLCTCAFDTIPETLDECKELFSTIHVNIFDLVEATRFGLKSKTFLHARDLAIYSRVMGRICPVEVAKEGTLVKALLRRFE